MLKLSKRIFVVYGLLLLIFLIFNLALVPLILLMIIISLVVIIITILDLFQGVINRINSQLKIKTLMVLLLPLVSIYTLRSVDFNGKVFLSAYSEGIINGADITFYQNKSMEYCSLSLIGEQCYKGNYEFKDNVFIVNYTCGRPRLKSTRMLIIGSDLLFIDKSNNMEYKFDIEREYLK